MYYYYQIFLLAIYIPGKRVIIYVIRYDRFRKAVQVMCRSTAIHCSRKTSSTSSKQLQQLEHDQRNDVTNCYSRRLCRAPSASTHITAE